MCKDRLFRLLLEEDRFETTRKYSHFWDSLLSIKSFSTNLYGILLMETLEDAWMMDEAEKKGSFHFRFCKDC